MSRACWTWLWPISVSALVLAAGACAGDPRVVPLRVLPPAALAQAGIGEVNVVDDSPQPYPGVASALQTALDEIRHGCANGPRKYRLDVGIERFKPRTFVFRRIVGDYVQLKARVRMIEPDTGIVAAEYRIDEWHGAAGQAEVEMLAEVEWNLPRLFAERLCRDVLQRPVSP